MVRTLLIVDDIKSNREILKNILGNEYTILEATNGQTALELMHDRYKQISAVLLDLLMPVMNGFEVLNYMRGSSTLAQLPVIVMTGQTDAATEEKALQLGAKDYISKPYKSAIIKQRIHNTINLRETAATVNELQRDRLTGLYNRATFFEKVAEMVSAHEPGSYILTCFDIDNFKVINDQYGTEVGDKVLKHVADCVSHDVASIDGICCRVTADNFALLYKRYKLDNTDAERSHQKAMTPPCINRPLSIKIGRYIINDLSLSPSAMYDRASMAEASVKGRYDRYIAFYDESMRDRLLQDQEIVTEMDSALKKRQFEAWFQPQYNHTSGALIGAEALVRWRHPQKGLIPPASFISIFEKNGFIYELDKFVWEEVCRYLRKWLDEGRSPLPVSVNISRYDIFRTDLVSVLTGLIAKYSLPVELLCLEITESAFAQSTEQIVNIVKQLIAFGFTVEIDDFGSGYSSLNTLKSVPAQIVKLDMRFLRDNDDSGRGGNIIESIIRMTKWLGMSVIAEGVENKKQADFLKSIGCSYVQGFLYARPMPAAEYEIHCQGAGKEERLQSLETVEHLDNNAFWDPGSMDTLIFNSYVGAACIYEYNNGKIELLRATDKYARMLGGPAMTVDDVMKIDFSQHLAQESGMATIKTIDDAARSKGEATGEFLFLDLPGCPHETYLRSTMQVIASAGERYLVYCISENITAQHQAERKERATTRQLQAIMDNVNCGITATIITDNSAELLFANNKYFELLGYTREQFSAEVADTFVTIYAEDIPRMVNISNKVCVSGKSNLMEYRAIRRDGSIIWLRSAMSMTSFEGIVSPVQLSFHTDMTAEKQAAQELLDNLPVGAALYEYDGEKLSALHLNKRYWELVDRMPGDYSEPSAAAAIHPDDHAIVKDELASALRQQRDIVCNIRVLSGQGNYRPFQVVGRIIPKADNKYAINVSYTPISDEVISIQEMLPIALTAVMDSSSDLSFVKDKDLRYICCSRTFAQMVGLQSERDVVGKSDYDLFEKALADQYTNDDRQLMANRQSIVDMIEHIPSADGKDHYSSTSKYLLYDSAGNVVGIYGTGRDVTEAREIKSQLELLTNNIPGGIAIYEGSPEALDRIRLTYFSDGFCRLFGYTREEYEKLAHINPLGLIIPEDLPVIMQQITTLVQDNIPLDCIYRVRDRNGDCKWINVKAILGEPHGSNMTVNAVFFDVSSRQEALEHLRISEEENRLALRHSQNVVCRYDILSRILAVSANTNPIFKMSTKVENVPYGPVQAGEISPGTAAAYTAFYESINRGEKNGSVVFQRQSTLGWRWIEAHFSTIFANNGQPVSAVISFTDISDRLEQEAAYKKWQQSLHEKKPETYSLFRCNISKKTVIDASEGALLNIRFQPEFCSFDEHTAQYVTQYVLEEDREHFSAFLNADALLAGYYQGKHIMTLEYREKLPLDNYRWLCLTVDMIEYPHSTDVEAYLLFEDIDTAKKAELATIERAETDPLTGILNRVAFAEKVDQLISIARPHTQGALLMLDIDGFKLVNDVFGHMTGDQALIDIAEQLNKVSRRGDLTGRLGGDEFAVFLNDIPGDKIAANKARQICELTRKAFSAEVQISGSVGIAVCPRDGTDFDTLYKKADNTLYYVKGSGRDNYAFYHQDMEDEHLKPEQDEKLCKLQQRKKKRRMLIVDDSLIDHALLTSIFADDFIVEKAKDGSTALIRLRHYGTAISVVLLDLMMPGMDGFAVLAKMQQSVEMQSIPVIVVSSDENRETSLKAIRAGATDFVLKPVDPDVLRIRVQSAISKAENERLRTKNSLLEYQNSEVARYKTVLEHCGITVVEYDWLSGIYIYDSSVTEHLAGVYNSRGLWHIFLADFVADTVTVKKMQALVHEIAEDRLKASGKSILVQLNTPANIQHWFKMSVYKTVNDFGLTVKVYITFQDTET